MYTHIFSFRKNTFQYQDPFILLMSAFLQKISIFWQKQYLYSKQQYESCVRDFIVLFSGFVRLLLMKCKFYRPCVRFPASKQLQPLQQGTPFLVKFSFKILKYFILTIIRGKNCCLSQFSRRMAGWLVLTFFIGLHNTFHYPVLVQSIQVKKDLTRNKLQENYFCVFWHGKCLWSIL